MARVRKQQESKLNFIANPEGFMLDVEGGMENEHLLPDELKWKTAFLEDRFWALYQLGFTEKEDWFTASFLFFYQLAASFARELTRQPDLELLREDTEVALDSAFVEDFASRVPFMLGAEYITGQWIQRIWQKLNGVFAAEIREYRGSVELYLTEKNQRLHAPGRIFFHLVENRNDEAPFAFLATYSTKQEGKRARHYPLKYALTEFESDNKKLLELLSTIGKAAEQSDFISELLESGELFYPLKLEPEEAYCFLKEIPLYESAGILCRVPNWWKRKYEVRVSVSLGTSKPSRVGMDALIACDAGLSLDGEQLRKEELAQLLMQAEGLVRIKGKWVEVDREKLQSALAAYEEALKITNRQGLSLAEAMRLELHPNKYFSQGCGEDLVEVVRGDWLRELQEKLRRPELEEAEPVPSTFCAQLRSYQKMGYSWLSYMQSLGFGACLADDMGLGKTVQVLALLEKNRVAGAGKALLVVPASLIGNWEKEIGRFAPSLPALVLHGKKQDEAAAEMFQAAESQLVLFITTYGMVPKLSVIQETAWDILILDEAQAIKNPGTKQTKAVKELNGKFRVALTGTPIENRLSDLWSLFDFLNPGLLGSGKEFGEFTRRLSEDYNGYRRLRNMVGPFILRRLKTDKTVISDLPEKLEIKEYVPLSKQQVALYQKLIDELKQSLEATEEKGIQRKGLILTFIMKFKQLCNHPDQYMGQEEFRPDYSGKFLRLSELCETIYAKRERVLVFTQFKEITDQLAEYLETFFQRKGLVLHGGIPAKKRTELVERFNGEEYCPFMVLSLKAGGVGLNLTGANHVIHFDRWWNPAVENQATDRAYRIGQKKNVMVHKLISRGTIEEKIDQILMEKEQMSKEIITAEKETWITELSNRELFELFRLD